MNPNEQFRLLVLITDLKLRLLRKHLSGQHDQSAHGHRWATTAGGGRQRILPGFAEQKREFKPATSVKEAVATANKLGVKNVALTTDEMVETMWRNTSQDKKREMVQELSYYPGYEDLNVNEARRLVKEQFFERHSEELAWSEVSDQEAVDLLNGVNKAIYERRAGPIDDLIIRGDSQSESWLNPGSGNGASGAYYPQGETGKDWIELYPRERHSEVTPLTQKNKSVVVDAYENYYEGVYTHEYGHHWNFTQRPDISSRADRLAFQQRNFIDDNISWYATTQGAELIAEAYAMSKHPDFGELPQITQQFIGEVLE